MSDIHQEISERAHRIWHEQGQPEGQETERWLQAERELHEGVDAESANEGEGSQTGAREYNEATRDFVQSGKVQEAAQDAAGAIDEGAEATELAQAEEAGKSRSRGKTPLSQNRPLPECVNSGR